MDPAIIIPVSMFASIFGVFYLFFSTRNRERLALIEKGESAEIFKARLDRASPIWKVVLLNLGLLLIFMGISFLVGNALETNTVIPDEIAYLAPMFFLSGISLLLGFYLTKKLKL
ncbi:DUF6249 domain-containing protein [Zunongwangia endophytica]|uniref:DUF6249 domain-containing protein n=1 Tax=Zunongwangia endophytica TaxID=1808945 RepID=A0ABV8HFC9_9FLAO|nr:DUF6249 domain-containing protein [Zunongwangia endophytica]MDN3593396.1 hypothetical protein [Zunongwangia endophytica]